MSIVLACATRRGYLFLQKLAELVDGSELTVCSFREEPHEPPFMQDIANFAGQIGARFIESKQPGAVDLAGKSPFELLFAVSWRYMIPESVYQHASKGSYVFHDSLLPKYRGFSPTVWAMINGETSAGATLLEMSSKVDEGDIVAQQAVEIGQDETIAEVMEKVNGAYLKLLDRNFRSLADGSVKKFPQDHAQATYGCKRLPEDGLIDWRQSDRDVHNLIRATTFPYPGAFTHVGGKKLTIWSACRAPEFPHYAGRVPGRIAQVSRNEGPVVLCGEGALRLKVVQWEGAGRQPGGEVIDKLGVTLGR